MSARLAPLLLALAACAPAAFPRAPSPPVPAPPAPSVPPAKPLAAVVHLSDPSRSVTARGLTNVRNALKALGGEDAHFVLVVHGQALTWLHRAEPENLAAQAAELLATGKVEIRVCAKTMEENHWRLADLAPGVVVVPSGTLEVLRLEREGYAYFHP